MKYKLSLPQMQEMISVFKNYPQIEEVVLFGSRAMNSFRPASDVDLALRGKINFDLTAQVLAALDEESSLPFKFDVVNYHEIGTPELKKHIDQFDLKIYP